MTSGKRKQQQQNPDDDSNLKQMKYEIFDLNKKDENSWYLILEIIFFVIDLIWVTIAKCHSS